MHTAADAYTRVAVQTRRDELILQHLHLVRHVLGRLGAELPPGVDRENIEAAGTLGLVEAAGNFDPERGVKFESYAYARVRGAMLDELRRNCALPQGILQQAARVRKAREELAAPATVGNLAAATGLSEDEVADCLAALRLTRPFPLEGLQNSFDVRPDSGQPPAEELSERKELAALVSRAIESLDERERLVVTLYFLEDLRLKEIGQLIELSESRVSRVLSSALFHLGEYLRARGYEGGGG